MSSTAAPYGLIPVKRHDNLPFAGATNDYRINPNGSTATMYFGTPVYVNAAGFLAPCTATGADATTNALPAGTTLTGMQGVFMGCEYTNAQGQRIWSNYYPTGVTGDIRAMVVDDPAVVFRVQSVGSLGQDSLGANVAFSAAPTGGSTVTGKSNAAVTATPVTTTAAFRIVGFADDPGSSVGDAFTDVLVKLNPGYHAFNNAVGL